MGEKVTTKHLIFFGKVLLVILYFFSLSAQTKEGDCKSSLSKLSRINNDWIPDNQPSKRHAGFADVPQLKPEYPAYLGDAPGALTKHGIILGPTQEFEAAFNPTAFVARDPKDGKEKVFMVVRGEKENQSAEWKRKSLPYLAISEDGIHFDWANKKPLFLPTQPYNEAGGIEDPRYVDLRKQPYQDPSDGKKFDGAIMYTAFDGKTARVAFAVFNHDNLNEFREKGPVFTDESVMKNPIIPENPAWNKSPAVIQYPDPQTGEMRNILYVGEGNAYHGGIMALEATKPFDWHWPEDRKPVITARKGLYDQNLVEPAFQPILHDLPKELAKKLGQTQGIYVTLHGDSPPKGYQVGYRIFSPKDPTGKPIFESKGPFLWPEEPWEIEGQVGKVVFASGSVEFKGRRFIYYGAADKYVGAVSAPNQ